VASATIQRDQDPRGTVVGQLHRNVRLIVQYPCVTDELSLACISCAVLHTLLPDSRTLPSSTLISLAENILRRQA
jgi:hypothetical protein